MKNLKALAALSVTTSLLVGAPIAHAGRGAYAFNADEVSQVAGPPHSARIIAFSMAP